MRNKRIQDDIDLGCTDWAGASLARHIRSGGTEWCREAATQSRGQRGAPGPARASPHAGP